MTEQTKPEAPAAPESNPAEQDDTTSTRLSFGQRMGRYLAHPKAPFYFLGAVVLVVAAFSAVKYAPRGFGSPNIVVFDPVRFVNAQRAAASILAVQQNVDLAFTMTQVAKQAESVIKAEARGAVILIRQAVVVPDDLHDITDAVLKHFDLPTNVPTVTTGVSSMTLENLAPTDSSFGAGALKEDYRMELEGRARDAAIKQEKKSGQDALIP